MLAEGVVGPGRHDARQDVVALRVLLANRLRRIPARIRDLARDRRGAERRRPVHAADADRMRDHSPRPRRNPFGQRTRLRREVIHPQLGDVDDDAPLRRARQHVERRDRDLRAFAGQPRVDAGIRLPQLFVTDVVGARQRYEGVFVARLDDLNARRRPRRLRRSRTPPPAPSRRRRRRARPTELGGTCAHYTDRGADEYERQSAVRGRGQ